MSEAGRGRGPGGTGIFDEYILFVNEDGVARMTARVGCDPFLVVSALRGILALASRIGLDPTQIMDEWLADSPDTVMDMVLAEADEILREADKGNDQEVGD